MALIRGLWLQLAIWLAAGTAATVPVDSLAQSQASPEYQLKAVFLFNFAQFVEWPASAFAGPDAPVVIGILGEDPFGSYLDETVRGEKVNDRPLVVRRFRSVEEITTCHILFISGRDKERFRDILDHLRGRSILTVSDGEGFATMGGMVRFVTDKNRIRFRINLEAAKAADLTLSSKLLRAAQIVGSGKD
jgi:hypothetical protein